uniref:Uncharacterized protein n=1 Tax=Arundo donax TaxID=35708 RepID=A0A0A9B7U7_ARUDO
MVYDEGDVVFIPESPASSPLPHLATLPHWVGGPRRRARPPRRAGAGGPRRRA